MLSKDQANAAFNALTGVSERNSSRGKPGNARGQRSRPLVGLVLGMAFGGLLGLAVCHWMVGRIQPGLTIGQGFGSGFGLLVGLYIDGKTSRRAKRPPSMPHPRRQERP